jgi:hypothetical protein
MNFVGLRITIFHQHLLMRLLNTCVIVNGLVDGWKGMGNGGSRSMSSLTVGRGDAKGMERCEEKGGDAKEIGRDVS